MGLARLMPRPKGPDQKTLLQCRPERHPEVMEERQGETLVLRPPTEKRSWSSWLWRRAAAFELDAVGELVWTQMDGKTTVERLAQKLSSQTKLKRVESQAGLLAFLDILAKRGLIRYLPPKKP